MNKIHFWFWVLSLLSIPSLASSQLFDYNSYFSQSTYGVSKTEDLVYGVGATNYYLYSGSGNVNSKASYQHVTRKPLEMDLFKPDMPASGGRRAVLILIPGSGRSGCLIQGFCSVNTVKQNNLSTSDAHYISQEGNDYNELNDRNNKAINYAKRGMVVVSPNTRYKYHNKEYDKSTANKWSRSDGSSLLNGTSTHLEPLVVDLKRLVRWLSHPTQIARHNIDPNNIYILGSSGAAKMASLAAITGTDTLLTDDPAQLNSGHSDHQFEVNNNNLNVTQKALRGVIIPAGDSNGTRNLQLMNANTDSAFMFWHGTTDRAILHGMAETIEEKCDSVGCATQFYSLPGVEHKTTGQGKTLHTRGGSETVGINGHVHDFMVNHLERGTDSRPEISISSSTVKFSESSGMARIAVSLNRSVNREIRFTMSADQMREVMQPNGAQGAYSLIGKYVANSSDSTGPVAYDQSTGVVYEKTSNLPAAYKNLTNHTSGPGQGNPVVIPSNSNYFNSDFNGKKQVLSIPAGQTSVTFNVGLVNDSLSEQNECFKVRLLNADGARITNAVETITILDDDNPNAGTGVSATCSNPNQSTQPPTIPPTTPPVASAEISVQPNSVGENAGQVTIAIVADIAVSNDVTLSYRTVGGSAESGRDFVAKQGQITIDSGSRNASVSVNISNDSILESDEEFIFELVSVVQGNASLASKRASITITDDDVNVQSVSINSASVGESSGTASIKVVTDRTATQDITLSYRTLDGTAKNGANADFISKQGQVTIRSSERQATIPITINDDSLVENQETFTVELTSVVGGNARIATGKATVTIVSDDTVIKPTLSLRPSNVKETSGTAFVLVSTDKAVTEDITFSYRTESGTATAADNDYEAKFGRATISRSRDSVTIPITINSDAKQEANESFYVKIDAITSGDASIGTGRASVTIIEGSAPVKPSISVLSRSAPEGGGNVSVQLSTDIPTTNDVIVDYRTVVGTAKSSAGDYEYKEGRATVRSGNTSTSVSITVNDDSKVEGDEIFGLQIVRIVSGNAVIGTAKANIKIIDDDTVVKRSLSAVATYVNESSGTAYVQIVSDRPVSGDVVLSYQTVVGTATHQDYNYTQGQVTLKKGREQTSIPITILNDSAIESPETFDVILKKVVSGDAIITRAKATVTVVDDESNRVDISISSRTVREDVEKTSVQVVASRPVPQDTVISYKTVVGTAKSSQGDYLYAEGTVVIPRSKTTASIPITIVDDKKQESDEVFYVKLQRVVSNNANIVIGTSRVTIVDDDQPIPPILPIIMMLLEDDI